MARSGVRGNGAGPEYPGMGDHLRSARRAHGLSLRELADRLGVSPSLISQVETGRASPSVSTLYAMAQALSVSVDDLLFDEVDRPKRASPAPAERRPFPVQRGTDRSTIRLASGVTWERLTTESEPGTDFLYVIYEVGGASSPEHEFQRHGGHEWGIVLEGTLSVTIGFDDYELGPGDAISIDSTVPHRMYNRGTVPVHGIWFGRGRRSLDVPGLRDE